MTESVYYCHSMYSGIHDKFPPMPKLIDLCAYQYKSPYGCNSVGKFVRPLPGHQAWGITITIQKCTSACDYA